MSLHPQEIPPIPEETARVARAILPQGNRYLLLRDELGTIYSDELFADVYPRLGQPAEQPWRLGLVTVMQFMENYTDRQAAEAVRIRIDWKYVLSLELTDPGFDFSVLSEFRTRLLESEQGKRLLSALLEQCRARGWRPFAPSIGWSVQEKRCERPSMTWQSSHPTGCAARFQRSGMSATIAGLRNTSCPKRRRSDKRWRSRSEPMAGTCFRRSTRASPLRGCEKSQPSRSCAGCGCSSST